MDDSPPTRLQRWQARLRRFRARLRSALPFAAGVLAALLAMVAYNLIFPPARPLTTREVSDTVARVLASATPLPAYSERVYQIIRPSLVLIQAHSPATDSAKESNSLGSGVVVNDNGDILTSLHVVVDSPDIQVTFADGTQSKATIITAQANIDIAVLHADTLPSIIVAATLGNPNAMQIGDEAYAVGNPFGLYGSMSAGVISSFNRSFEPSNGHQKLEGLIQIDTAVNPGNSGGPLLNRNGEVIGIVEGIINPTGQEVFIGIGFAVPITTAGGAFGSPPY